MPNDTKTRLGLPKALRPGDTIGIVAPAGPFDKGKFFQGIKVLEEMGFNVFIPDDLLENDEDVENENYLAGTDTQRSNLVNRLFADRKIKAIFCARGGFGSVRILSLLDYELIKKNPKIVMGFSDISALLSVLYSKCGLVTFHGPVVTTLATCDQDTKEGVVAAITSGKKLKIKPSQGIIIKPGSAVGVVSGGNLATLCHLTGTPFEPSFNGHIVVLEDICEPHYKIDRMLIQMKLAGCFKGIAGLVLGSFEDCGGFDGILRIVERIFREDDIPILGGFAIGHGNRNVTIPMGIKATLDTDCHMLLYHEPATGR